MFKLTRIHGSTGLECQTLLETENKLIISTATSTRIFDLSLKVCNYIKRHQLKASVIFVQVLRSF